MKIISLDPRIARAELPEGNVELHPLDEFPTYEVFHQKKRGEQHEHVGIVHAPNDEMALLFAKDQYARRGTTVNIWVVKSEHVIASSYDDTDIFMTTPDKQYREAGGYKVMDKINKFKGKA
jgi:ring-1,2-phenylacetyl-CoA epoxidase subunit PaaB